jgi:hypothetical protein
MPDKYQFRKMAKGQRVELDGADFDTVARIRSAACYFAKRNPGWKFTTRRGDDGKRYLVCVEVPTP